MSTPEGLVLKAVCDYLALQERLGRCIFWRQNNGATYDPKRKAYRAPKGAGYKYGVPDVLVVIAGRCIGIECKAEGGRMSDSQNEFKAALKAAGGVYIVARGVRDVEPLFP